jgi:hypothetical protein
MSLIDDAMKSLDSAIDAESTAEKAKEERKAAKLAKQKAMLSQPGYVFNVYFNKNAPYSSANGFYTTTCRLASTENGAPALPEELEQEFAAWSYEATNVVNRLRSKGMLSFKLAVFIPASYFESEDKYPMIEIDSIMTDGVINGRLCENAAGEELIIPQGTPVPQGFETVKKDAFKLYIESHLILESETHWDPQARNPHKGLALDALKARLAKSAAIQKRTQEAGLNKWRNDNAATSATDVLVNDVLQDAVVPTKEPVAKKTRASKAV